MRRKLIFPAMCAWWLVMMMVAREYPDSFVAGADVMFLVATIVCAILSWIGFVYVGK